MATDESELISIFQRKHENKARFAEAIRERQQRMMDINEGIRSHDLRQVREEELDRVKAQMSELNGNWDVLKRSIEEKLKFCEKIHRKHEEEVKEYKAIAEDVEFGKFGQKLKGLTFELQGDKKSLEKSVDELKA